MQSKFKKNYVKYSKLNTQFRFSKFEFRIESHYRWQLFCHRWLFVCRQMCIVIKTSENFICVVKFEFLSVCLSTKDRNVKQKDRKNSEKRVNKYRCEFIEIFLDCFKFECLTFNRNVEEELVLYDSFDASNECVFCRTNVDNTVDLGKKITVGDTTVHHFCLVRKRANIERQNWFISKEIHCILIYS